MIMTALRTENLPTIERLREILSYDPETGLLRKKVGDYVRPRPTGSIVRGYLRVSVDNQVLFGHRVIWAIYYGRWPESIIDHANGDKADNRITNLRLATKVQNAQNRKKTVVNTSGFKGVYWHKKAERWYSIGRVSGKQTYLGLYDTREEAHEAYKAFMNIKAGEFARHE